MSAPCLLAWFGLVFGGLRLAGKRGKLMAALTAQVGEGRERMDGWMGRIGIGPRDLISGKNLARAGEGRGAGGDGRVSEQVHWEPSED